ncbi:MAG: HIT domain-containing protein [candidate division Zixibacteria bacterium]|nr:HIT domain-containing protein [candidate division Zixibacteria bacterium]
MENLWAEWRSDFILGEKDKYCIFCEKGRRKKKQRDLILYEGEYSFVIINLYPYNPGHLMIVPYRHLRNVENLKTGEHHEMIDLVVQSIRILKKIFKPHGFNTGMNLGAVAGAGIEYHLHYHVVPRFNGDINFLPAIGKTKLLSIGLDLIHDALKPEFDRYAMKVSES